MSKHSYLFASVLSVFIFLAFSFSCEAGLEDMLKDLKKSIPNQQQNGQQTQNNISPRQNTPTGNAFSYRDSCKNVQSLLGTEEVTNFKPENSLISSEFNIVDLDELQTKFVEYFGRKQSINKSFVNASFWQHSFETSKVRTYFDSFLAYPEPAVLNGLIVLSRNTRDKQLKTDALMALVFIHLQAPELSINKNRPFDLYREVAKTGDSYPREVFRSRLYAFGEGELFGEGGGNPNPKATMGYLQNAAGIASSAGSSGGFSSVSKEWDQSNSQEQASKTVLYIVQTYPNSPYAQNARSMADMASRMQQSQDAYMRAFFKSKEANLIYEAQLLSSQASQINENIIQLTKDSNKSRGQLQSQQSLEDAHKDGKVTFVYTDPKAEFERIKALKSIDNISPEQKKLLAESQLKRLTAQNLLYEVSYKLGNEVISNMGNFEKMTAPVQVMGLTQNMLYQSCTIADKWEKALRAKDIASPNSQIAAENAGSASKKYGKE